MLPFLVASQLLFYRGTLQRTHGNQDGGVGGRGTRSLRRCCPCGVGGDAPLCSKVSQAEVTVSRADEHGQGGVVLWFPWQKTGQQWKAFCAGGSNWSSELELQGAKGRGFISLK